MDKFRNIGLKLTPQRLAILEYLEGNKGHPSAEDIYTEIRKSYPTLSFATVYKTLETLKKNGYILELTIDRDRRRFDPDTGTHHHLMCVNCRKIVDIHKDFAVSVPDEEKDDFDIVGNHIEFYGICPVCKTKGGIKNGGI